MTAREFLDQYRVAYSKAARLKEKLDQLKEDCDSTQGGIVFTSRKSGISNPTERKAERVQIALDKWANAQLDSVEIRQEITDVIFSIEDINIMDVLWYRYLGLLNWAEVCDAVGYSWPQVRKFHKEGLEVIDRAIN